MRENILNSFLKKLGVNDYSELSELEKSTYKQWEQILNKTVRIEDVAIFLEVKVKNLQKDLHDAIKEGDDRMALHITAKIENYETIILFIKEPLERRKHLERQLLDNLE